MKKRIKIIISISVILLIAILLVELFIFTKVEFYDFTIVKINKNHIIAGKESLLYKAFDLNNTKIKDENKKELDIENIQEGNFLYAYDSEEKFFYFGKVDKLENNIIHLKIPQLNFYSFYVKNDKIKNNQNKIVDISNLKEGDTIDVINIVPTSKNALGYIFEGQGVEYIDNVKSVKITEKNKEEVELIENRNMIAIKEAIIVALNENNIIVKGLEDEKDIVNVKYINDEIKNLKEGQKVIIYFNGIINHTTNTIENVGKMENIN